MDGKLKGLVGIVLILVVVIAFEVNHFEGIVRDLQGNTVPDGSFLFTTSVEVAYIDADGNVVDSYLKVGDLPTKNFGYAMALMFGSYQGMSILSTYNNTWMKDVTGIQRSLNVFPTPGVAQHDYISTTYARIGWGSGTTAATVDDFELDTKDTWDTIDQVTYYENTTHMWTKMQMTHEFTTGVTINEVGLYVMIYEMSYQATSSEYRIKDMESWDVDYDDDLQVTLYDASTQEGTFNAYLGNSYGQYLLFRDVLGSSVTVPDNEAVTITYWIYLQYG